MHNQHLFIDTTNFESAFKDRLIAGLESLDSSIDGHLIHSDNFQAINFVHQKYSRSIDCIYIDPPYNTAASPILYKNGYKSSSWMSLMNDRLAASNILLRNDGVLVAAIDDVQQREFSVLIENNISGGVLGTICVRSNPSGRPTKTGYAVSHEYLIFAAAGEDSAIGRLPLTDDQLARFNQKDATGFFEWRNLRREGSNSDRTARRALFYPIYIGDQSIRVPKMEWNDINESWVVLEEPSEAEKVVLPINDDGLEKTWRWEGSTVMTSLSRLAVRKDRSGNDYVYYKRRPNEGGAVSVSSWMDAKYSATEHGTSVLKALFGKSPFDYPKSIHAVMDAIYISGAYKNNSRIFDYFGGSGTTAHATIKLNRRDGGARKYVLAEMGTHIDSVLIPRIKKVIYSNAWNAGKPLSRENGISHCLKILRLESFEDTLNNLILPDQSLLGEKASKENQGIIRDYTLRYWLDFETANSPSLLNVKEFADPTAYKLKIKQPGSDVQVEKAVDLVETFNWLIGLHVALLDRPRRYAIDLQRVPDPDLPDDQQTRWHAASIKEIGRAHV